MLFLDNVIKFPQHQIFGNPSIESSADMCGQTDEYDEGKGVFRECEHALKERLLIWKDYRKSGRTIGRESMCEQKGNVAGRRLSAAAHCSRTETRAAVISNVSRNCLVECVEIGWRDAKTGL